MTNEVAKADKCVTEVLELERIMDSKHYVPGEGTLNRWSKLIDTIYDSGDANAIEELKLKSKKFNNTTYENFKLMKNIAKVLQEGDTLN